MPVPAPGLQPCWQGAWPSLLLGISTFTLIASQGVLSCPVQLVHVPNVLTLSTIDTHTFGFLNLAGSHLQSHRHCALCFCIFLLCISCLWGHEFCLSLAPRQLSTLHQEQITHFKPRRSFFIALVPGIFWAQDLSPLFTLPSSLGPLGSLSNPLGPLSLLGEGRGLCEGCEAGSLLQMPGLEGVTRGLCGS